MHNKCTGLEYGNLAGECVALRCLNLINPFVDYLLKIK